MRGNAVELAPTLGRFDFAYLDPPYNQHRYEANYHVWETLVAWDAPAHYGIACKREELSDRTLTSAFNRRREMPGALAACIAAVDARVVVVSYNDESWIDLDELVEMCRVRGAVEVLAFDSKRYVGAQIGIHNRSGERVGAVSHLRNTEYLVVCGDRTAVDQAVAAVGVGSDGAGVPVPGRRRPKAAATGSAARTINATSSGSRSRGSP